MGTAWINGTVIAYDDVGPAAATPLVLVHGHPFDRSMWRPQVEHFTAAGRRVIAPDLRGYGQSAPGGPEARGRPAKTTLDSFAADIASLLDHLGLGAVVLGGLSMGGQIVMDFHRRFPERVRGLILADTSAQAESAEGRRLRNEVADRLLREGMAAHAEEVLPRMVTPANIEALPAVAEHVLGMMRAASPQGAAAALRGRAERPDYVETLSRVAVPALVVVGAEDDFTPVRDAELLCRCIPDATLAVIGEAGHMPNLERPKEFNDAVERFLDRLEQ